MQKPKPWQRKLQRTLDKWVYENTPEQDKIPPVRPADNVLYGFITKLTDDYSWRDDIHGDKMIITVFKDDQDSSYEPYHYDILRWLASKKYLRCENNRDGTVSISQVDDTRLYELQNSLRPDIIPAIVVYYPVTRTVIFNGKRTNMHKGPTAKIFRLLALNANERLSKELVWREIGERTKLKRERDKFSVLIQRVRISVGASLEEIELHDTVTLHANIEIID